MGFEIGENLQAVFPWAAGAACILGFFATVIVLEILEYVGDLSDAVCKLIKTWRER